MNWNAMKLTIGAVALAGALWGCGGDDPAAQGTGGGGGTAAAGAGGTVGSAGTSGTSGAAGGAVAARGGSGAGAAGASGGSAAAGAGARGGSGAAGTAGAAGAAGSTGGGGAGAPPTCDSLGWTPGDASLCGASKGTYACAYCSLPGPPVREPDCVSTTAFQSASVLCVSDCASCR